jgi:transposase
LVFLDKTWAKTNMAPLRGWAPCGQRLDGHHPHGHRRTMTFPVALRANRIDAPCVFDGPINGKSFTAWVEHALVPTLSLGDLVVIDNRGGQRRQAICVAIRAAGAHLLFLPPYSPDLSPIEPLFAKLKHFLREAAGRTVETVMGRIAANLERFTPQGCANDLVNSGYASV